MRCTSPKTVGFQSDGKTICWSPINYSKEYATFQLPCGKCLHCRLERARETATRCYHEAQMYQNNSFVTLTYSDEHTNGRLIYDDFQLFQKKLRNYIFINLLNKMFPDLSEQTQKKLWKETPKERRDDIYGKIKIGILVTGEYGDQTKRPHWHALIFNWRPDDMVHKYTSDRGDKAFSSKILDELWGNGITETGDITFESAGYCARYAAKKLVHGYDGEHDFEPISRRSSKNAIGKRWIEKYWTQTFQNGYVNIKKGDGQIIQSPIPRYYEKWFKKNHPDAWQIYITQQKVNAIRKALQKEEKEKQQLSLINEKRIGLKGPQLSKNKARAKILEAQFKTTQNKGKI